MIDRLLHLPVLWQRVGLAAAACVALAACQPSATLSTGANVPAQYSHVWVTLKQVAFNTSATAGPTDSGWQQFSLSSPETIDLATVTNGALAQFASKLSLSGGTYSQMRLVLTDSNVALTSSAQAAGAQYNDEVDYVDSSGTLVRVPLQVPNAAQGVTFAISLTMESAEQATLQAIACAASSSSSGTTSGSTCEYGTQTASDCTSGTFYDSLIGTCVEIGSTTGTTGSTITSSTTAASTSCAYGTTYDSSTGSCVATSTGTSTGTTSNSQCSYGEVYDSVTGTCASSGLGTSAATSYVAVDFDASRDLVPYTVSGQSGFVLIPHLTAYNLSDVGTIEGQVDVSGLPSTGVGGIEVTAETSNGTQNLIVASAPLQSSGSFVLYPLPCSSTSSSSSSSSYSSSSSSATYSCGTATQYYDLVIHGPGIQTVIIQSVPVSATSPSSASSISFGVTLTAATSYTVNLSSAASPPGSWIGFYQTLPSSSAPYLIEAYPVDPFTGTFDTAQALSSASLQYGTYTSGGSVSLTNVAPAQGTSTYSVGASAPVYGNGPLSSTVAPTASGSTSTATFTAAAIPLPSAGESVSGTVSVTTPGKYDKGELLLTQGGALVAVMPLDADLAAAKTSATLFSSVPGGTSTSVYYAEAWVWNSANPAATLSRQPVSAPIDLSAGNATGVSVTIN